MKVARILCVLLALATLAHGQPAIDAALLAKADGGDPAAQVAVGEKYAQAAAVAQDPGEATESWNKAIEWYARAAAKDYAQAEIRLADAYAYGRGVPRDKVKAVEWYRKAAEQGDAGAQGTLGMLYALGQGVAPDDAEAYFWFDLAASIDSPNQQRYITNRQNVGTRITAEQLAAVEQRLKKWKAAHPR